jgi:D-glycero-alpha-D-manno-heptose-7-phosphate kinase
MVICKTPMRISFLGGGTDYPDYYRRHGGQVFCTSIDKYSYIVAKSYPTYFENHIKVSYSQLELVKTIDELHHPIVRECFRFLGIERDIEIQYTADLPARTGMGSSSSFTVCLLHSLYTHKGEVVSKRRLAEEAVYIEQEILKERVGSQDQFGAAIGGLQRIRFGTDGHIDCEPIPLTSEKLEAFGHNLILFYTGLTRTAHEVVKEQIDNTKSGSLDEQLHRLGALVDPAVDAVLQGKFDTFGEILECGWQIKQSLSSQIANTQIVDWYEKAKAAGAIGGKLLGAGGGGCLLFYAPQASHNAIRAALEDLQEIPFRFDREGSSVIFVHR